jgi:hypothetical protein
MGDGCCGECRQRDGGEEQGATHVGQEPGAEGVGAASACIGVRVVR